MQAGMNDFVTKPINPEALWLSLLRWVAPRDGLGIAASRSAQRAVPAAFDASATQASLRRIPDLDVDMGLRSTADDLPFYVSMLTKFIAGQSDAIQRMVGSLEAGDTAGAELVAHTLKGVASNLGMRALANSAGDLEHLLNAGALPEVCDAVTIQTQGLLDTMLDRLNAIAGIQANRTTVAVTGLTSEERTAAFARLAAIKDLLAQNDANAAELWETHASVLMALLPNGLDVQAAIAGYDFELAFDLLQRTESDALRTV
jgi:HPt (histidine-containing phosphotransfer) domain-containing protein